MDSQFCYFIQTNAIKAGTMKKVVVFDIDGTLADITHRRQYVATKPKNWVAFNAGMIHDTPHWDVVEVLSLYAFNYPIVLCSGRGEETRLVTETWLRDQLTLVKGENYEELYMRPHKDHRPDDIIKEELLDRMLSEGYEPHVVFDDRDRVVAMWRRRGYRCFQVAPGDF
jgi:hydroxymethylpyrimidine pyrophosphatase-like HAD family hydrolase